MKIRYLGFLVLALISGPVLAQPGEWYDAVITENMAITDPAKAMAETEGQWLAFRLPVLDGTRSPCCWKGHWNGMGETGCSLENRHQSYGSRSDAPLAENVIVFGKVQNGQVDEVRVVGESCPVEASGEKVTWLGDVDTLDGLNWLEAAALADKQHSKGGSALFALALHRDELAGRRLYTFAKQTNGELSEQAIFWLGEARGQQGYTLLKQLLDELPGGERRREINFALAQNNTAEAAGLLFDISKSDPDPEQRGEAMFWLAEEYPQRAQSWLLEVIKTERDEEVLEQAVFAISQLPGNSGDLILLDLARNGKVARTVRRQALFWLAQSDNDSSIAALTELLKQP